MSTNNTRPREKLAKLTPKKLKRTTPPASIRVFIDCTAYVARARLLRIPFVEQENESMVLLQQTYNLCLRTIVRTCRE